MHTQCDILCALSHGDFLLYMMMKIHPFSEECVLNTEPLGIL